MNYSGKKGSLALTFLVLALSLAAIHSQTAAGPGGITVSANLKYLNNMFGLIFPITMQNLIQNKTLELDLTESGFGYKAVIRDIHVDNIAFKKKEIKFLPGTNTARLYIDGFDLNCSIDGTITALWVIPMTAASLNITNLTMQFDITALD